MSLLLSKKICKKCSLEKDACLFVKNRSICKKCRSIYQKTYNKENKERIRKQSKKYREINKDKICNKSKEWRNKNKDKLSNYNKYWKLNNKNKIKKYDRIYNKNRLKTDIEFKIRQYTSSSIGKCLSSKNISKNKESFLNKLGYSIHELKSHLESQFEPWMSWDNWGTYRKNKWDDKDKSTWTWQIDHIIPQSCFSFTSMDDDEFKECWSLENLRPYSAKQNVLDKNKR